MKPSPLYTAVMEQAIAEGGELELDFSNELHYNFFMELGGGADYVSKTAPGLFQLAKMQRTNGYRSYSDNKLGLSDTFCHDGLTVTSSTPSRKNGATFSLKSLTSLSLCSNTAIQNVYLNQYFVDNTTKNILNISSADIAGENNYFQNEACCNYTGANLMDTPIRIDCIYSMIDQTANENAMLRSHVYTTVATVPDFQNYVEEVKLNHPVISKTRNIYKDFVCISYNRQSQMENPDYQYDETLPHGITDMPVFLPISLDVTLNNGTYFYQSDKRGYFYEQYDPRINLTRVSFDHVPQPGGTKLMLDWKDISEKNITILDYNRDASGNPILQEPNKLSITFPTQWTSKFHSDALLDATTQASLYANILLNACHLSKENGLIKYFVSIIIQHNQQNNSYQAYVEDIFFQWGCVARDTELLTPSGSIVAENVQQGDFLLSSDGTAYPVQDITTGTEAFLLEFKTDNHVLRVSKTHPLCMADHNNSPLCVPACDVQPGQYIFEWSASEQKAVPSQIKEINSVPYNDTVYNFSFGEEREIYMIGNGIVIGDNTMQKHCQPQDYIIEMKQPTPEMKQLDQQLGRLFPCQSAINENAFQQSNFPESYAMHYFAAKYLLTYNCFSPTEAQDIAEYCQFLGDNATTGYISVDTIPEWINEAGFYRIGLSKCFDVPLIPSAMKNWYNSEELSKSYPWFPDDESYGVFNVQEDILRPFHFFPGQIKSVEERVVVNPDKLHHLMEKLAENVYSEKYGENKDEPAELSEELKMKVGFYLHILMDTILHQNFCAKSSWINMAYREAVYLPDGSHVEKSYPPYKNFDDDALYNESTVYPAGLEKMGWTVNETFLQLSYQYPTNPEGLGMQSNYAFWNNYSRPNNASYAYDLEAVDTFLKKCMHQTSGVSWSDSSQCQRIRQNFACTEHSFDKLKAVWQEQESPMDFHYDAAHVFQKITDPDSSKTAILEKYSNFFNYTKILYDLQHNIARREK